jgi:sugar O-acyltransferase (sialic acid O-acetyltransferase NeuD family)
MKDIAIIGAGGFGRETAWLIHEINRAGLEWNFKGYYDDHSQGVMIDGSSVIGKVSDLDHVDRPLAVVIAIASPAVRKSIYQKISNPNISFPSLFHPKADKGDAVCTYGQGCVITNACILTVNVHVKDFVIINLGTSVGHDVTIGSFTSIMPDCSISGFATIGDECQIGAGVRILPGLSVGSHCVVGAGAVVTKSFGENAKLIGVPAINVADDVEGI